MTPLALLTLVSALGLTTTLLFLWLWRRESTKHWASARSVAESDERLAALQSRFRTVIDADEELRLVEARTASELVRARTETASITDQHDRIAREVLQLVQRRELLQEQVALLEEEATLQSFGFYKPRFNLSKSVEYELRLAEVREKQKVLIKNGRAALGDIEWTVNGSAAEGRKQINQTLKLMLRAFNGECDAAIAKVRYNNIHVMEARIRKACDVITSLAAVQRCRITSEYLDLKLSELALVHEFEEKLQQEKEEQRRIREQMREEEIALRELEKARVEAEREERRFEEALAKARAEVENAQGAKHQRLSEKVQELERRLADAHAAKERAIARAQLTRSGHVYVISNIGSFGEHVYKIGMTRRLDPQERIRELGDASVPFPFDVHAVLYSDDAPGLETALHRAFDHKRLNLVNERKEFFAVSIEEIAGVVRQHHGDVLVTRVAEAEEFRKTQAMRTERRDGIIGWGEYDRRRVSSSGDAAGVA